MQQIRNDKNDPQAHGSLASTLGVVVRAAAHMLCRLATSAKIKSALEAFELLMAAAYAADAAAGKL